MIEPGSLVRKTQRFQSIEVANCSLKADRRWVNCADRGISSGLAFKSDHSNVERFFVEKRHVHGISVTPKAEEYQVTLGQLFACEIPDFRRNDHAWPGTLRFNAETFDKNFSVSDDIIAISLALSQKLCDVLEPRNQLRR